MKRRTFLGALAAVGGAIGLSVRHVWGYGYVDIARAQANGWSPARVLLDGVDVSSDCYAVDDRAGYVALFKRNANGRHYLDDDRVAVVKEIRYGRVQFFPKAKA